MSTTPSLGSASAAQSAPCALGTPNDVRDTCCFHHLDLQLEHVHLWRRDLCSDLRAGSAEVTAAGARTGAAGADLPPRKMEGSQKKTTDFERKVS
eukprot:3190999-Prymnesium_polylepis.1